MGRKFSAVIIALISVVVLLPICASANSAEPPTFVILCNNCPDDTEINIIFDDGYQEQTNKSKTAWDTYFQSFGHYTDSCAIIVKSSAKNFELSFETSDRYNQYYTLDFKNETIVSGDERVLRTPVLIALRVVLTLVTEGLIFFAFGYRQKRSWTIFLALNLFTQTILNIMISKEGPPLWAYFGYWYLIYFLMEFFIFAIEMTAIPLMVKEQPKWKGILCAFTANAVSWFVGGLIIMLLPI